MNRYFKPRSLTWWSAVAPLVCGLVVASLPMHGLEDLTATIEAATGNVAPAVLINAGLAGIGLRGAMG